MDSKQELKEIFEFAIYKLDNNLCTPDEMNSFADAAKEHLNLLATTEEMAKFYGVSDHQVRSAINRKLISKPKRRVYYRFLDFMKVAPEKWHK